TFRECARTIDFSHAARADGRKDLVRSEMGPGRQRHRVGLILSHRMIVNAWRASVAHSARANHTAAGLETRWDIFFRAPEFNSPASKPHTVSQKDYSAG